MLLPTFLVLAACTTPDAPPPRAETTEQRAQEAPQVEATSHAADGATRALYLANCAQCHGEKGDGEGVTQLDRKARSFLDGGFSYGNTKDAILRSIAHGIPGTPMPSFEKALDPQQIAALTDYVIALGPERIVVDPSESEMVVRDRPLLAYGKLPPIAEGGSEIARGLAIGTPDGLTFEYRTDDVQLVGVRVGRFVNRTDWGGRGGTALEMLGKPFDDVKHANEFGRRSFAVGFATEPDRVRCRLRAAGVDEAGAYVNYDVVYVGLDGVGERLAEVEERPTSYESANYSGYRRAVRITALRALTRFEFLPARRPATHGPMAHTESSSLVWNDDGRAPSGVEDDALVVVRDRRADDGRVDWKFQRAGGGSIGFGFDLKPAHVVELDVFVVPNAGRTSRSEKSVVAEFGQP